MFINLLKKSIYLAKYIAINLSICLSSGWNIQMEKKRYEILCLLKTFDSSWEKNKSQIWENETISDKKEKDKEI